MSKVWDKEYKRQRNKENERKKENFVASEKGRNVLKLTSAVISLVIHTLSDASASYLYLKETSIIYRRARKI